ncbi:MAG TPA: biopolymer transporter ExbD [Planctomycetaceae bacterium]|jgi:biopolymer transport protein ExbD|nr:biopolymer transporter ExbD [Planctomycetaceae bacterium]
MAIRYHCPNCGQFLSIATRLAGKQTTCPTCGTGHTVPQPEDADSVDPTPVGTAAPGAVDHREARLPAKENPVDPSSSLPQGPSFPITYAIDPLDDDDDEEALVIGKIERKSDELDLIPMVDCVFLLLVFYMITASYALQKTIEMGKPAAEKKGALQAVQSSDDTAKSSVVVQIDARNRISVDDVPLASASGLADVLRAKMNGDQKNELVVEADPRAFNETIVAVVDAAHELQFQHVRMAMTTGEGD